MLVVVLIFLFLITVVLPSFSAITFGRIGINKDFLSSRKSYFLAEAGAEDVFYRTRQGMEVASSNDIALDSDSVVTTTVVDGPSIKTISSSADVSDLIRNVELQISAGSGASFSYGIQSGNGGFILSNNATVNGSVYSNGYILGSNGSTITGSAISANSPELSADQYNDSPATPPNGIMFGNSSGSQDLAQSFSLNNAGPLSKISMYIKKVGTPSDITVRIVSDNGGSPSDNTIVSATLSRNLISTTYSWVDVSFSEYFQLPTSVTYWLVFDGGTSSTKYYVVGANNSFTGGVAKVGQYDGVWNSTSPAGLSSYFKMYLGGLNGYISNVDIGTAGIGDANAYQVVDSTIAGTLYCQIGSSNNKACNSSGAIPGAQDFPVSSSQIEDWKTEAVAGQTINGNYNLSSSGSLGPAKIVGNLTVEDNRILTMTGTIWVTGNIVIENGSSVVLGSGYGSGSGVLLADGRIDISNNTTFAGSGQSGSYIMALTTSDCPLSDSCNGDYAIEVENNIEAVILNAQNGTIKMSNNANAKQITAYKVFLEENTEINYETGMTNASFVNGPSGGWSVSSWGETQ